MAVRLVQRGREGTQDEAGDAHPFRKKGLRERGLPFAAAVAVGAVTMVAAGTRPHYLGAAFSLLVLLAALVVPWTRLPRWAATTIPLAYLLIIFGLTNQGGRPGAATFTFAPFQLLPLFWIALYGSRGDLAFGFSVLGLALLARGLLRGFPPDEVPYRVLAFSVSVVVGFATHALVREHRARAHTLALSEASFRSLVANAPIGISIMIGGRVVLVNHALVEILGAAEAELLGKGGHALLPPASAAGDSLLTRRDGSTATVVSMSVPISFEGHSAAVGIVRDVTEERRLQAVEREQARLDPLTGLYNRRGFDELIQREAARADRSQRPLSFALFDLDHFKGVNDRFGHDVGDQVLRRVADVLARAIRGVDVGVRWGGEELLAVLPDTDLAGALSAAERIREAVESLEIPVVGRVTISAGVAERQPHEDPGATLKRADEQLYLAKNAGRNRLA